MRHRDKCAKAYPRWHTFLCLRKSVTSDISIGLRSCTLSNSMRYAAFQRVQKVQFTKI